MGRERRGYRLCDIHIARFRDCRVNRDWQVVLMILLSWLRGNKPLRVSEASLRLIRARERERLLSEEADKRHARVAARLDLIIKPQ